MYENTKLGNNMEKYLEGELLKLNISITNDVKGNAVFAILPEKIIESLQEFCYFYLWNPNISEVRFVMSFDLLKEDIDFFIEKIKE